ncbi:Serum response factor-binding protein 1 [Sparganum proliferum]
MLMDAYRDERHGTCAAYRTDGKLLSHRRMHLQSRVSTTAVHELLFADACTLRASSRENMQRSMDLFAIACDNVDLVINTDKQWSYIKRCLRRTSNRLERRPITSRGQLNLSGQHPLPHQKYQQ